jgi:hypothetical protein
MMFKRLFPSKILADFIDIGNYSKPLQKYAGVVESLMKMSKD